MPRIATFMYCDKAEPSPNGGLRIDKPLLAFTPMFIPGMYSFSVVAGITDINFEQEHALRVTFSKPNEEPLVDTKEIPIGPNIELDNQNELPPEHKGILFNLDFRNVILKEEGLYKTDIFIDGKKIDEFPIYVQKGKEQ